MLLIGLWIAAPPVAAAVVAAAPATDAAAGDRDQPVTRQTDAPSPEARCEKKCRIREQDQAGKYLD